MTRVNVYVGRTKDQIVLRMPVSLGGKELYHRYDLSESPDITAYHLKLTFRGHDVDFSQLKDAPEGSNIQPADQIVFDSLRSAYKEANLSSPPANKVDMYDRSKRNTESQFEPHMLRRQMFSLEGVVG